MIFKIKITALYGGWVLKLKLTHCFCDAFFFLWVYTIWLKKPLHFVVAADNGNGCYVGCNNQLCTISSESNWGWSTYIYFNLYH